MTEEHKKYDRVYPLIYDLKEKKYYIGNPFNIQKIEKSDLGMLVYWACDGTKYNGNECYCNYSDALFRKALLNQNEEDFDLVLDLF